MDDCARLENVFTREGNGGSNPFLSAEKKETNPVDVINYPEICLLFTDMQRILIIIL